IGAPRARISGLRSKAGGGAGWPHRRLPRRRYPVAMPTYQRLGRVPRKRHIQFRENGTLLTEEVMGLEGFVGNESILYHLHSPCRVKGIPAFEPLERKEWTPDGHGHRHFRTMGIDPAGDAISGRH